MTYIPRKPRPNTWKYPYDRDASNKHKCWSRAKAQANYRGEGWLITDAEWMLEVWPPHLWPRRGRDGEDLCLIRHDNEKPWSKDNTYIVTRRTQLILQKHPRSNVDMVEIEQGVWDISGETLKKHLRNKVAFAKYRNKAKENKK